MSVTGARCLTAASIRRACTCRGPGGRSERVLTVADLVANCPGSKKMYYPEQITTYVGERIHRLDVVQESLQLYVRICDGGTRNPGFGTSGSLSGDSVILGTF
jgi:hypothetical protein